jgi:hypothetical protein
MKRSKSILLLYSVVALATLFFVLVGLGVYSSLNKPTLNTPQLSYSLIPSQTNVKVGDKIYVPVYLNGRDAYRVTAYDVKLYYDPTNLRLTKVTPGGFFEKYLTVKWDQKNNWYALAMTPGNPRVLAQPTLPILILELTTIRTTPSTPVSTVTSQVYLTKTGGFHPKMGTVSFSIL